MALSANPRLSFSVVPVTSAMVSGFISSTRIYTSGNKVGKGTADEWMEHKGSFGFLRLVGVRCPQVQVRCQTPGSHGLSLAMV